MSNIGFIGLGIMGKPMAANLIKGGHTLFLHSRSGVPKELTDAGGTACANAKEVAQKSDIIIIMVPDTPDVEKALWRLARLELRNDARQVFAQQVDVEHEAALVCESARF